MNKLAIVALIVFLAAFGFTAWYYGKTGDPDIRCQNDTECSFVRTKCCPDCKDFKSVNSQTAIFMNAEYQETCKEECNQTFCDDKTGGIVTTYPKCVENKCAIGTKVNCENVCKYFFYYYLDKQIVYLKESASALGYQRVTDMVNACCQPLETTK